MRPFPLVCVLVCAAAFSPVLGNVQSLKHLLNPLSTVRDAVGNFSSSLAMTLENLDFFDNTAINPVHWPLDVFDYDDQSKTLTVRGSYSSSVEVIPSFLTVTGLSVQVTLTVTAGDVSQPDSSLRLSLTGFAVSGTWTVGSASFDLMVTKDSEGLSFQGTPNPSTIQIDSLLSSVGEVSFLPAGLDTILSDNAGLDSFSLEQASFSAFYSKTKGYAASFSGFPTVSGWGSFKLNVILQRLPGQKSVVTMTAKFQSFRLASLVDQLTGIDISSVPVVGSVLLPEIGLIISSGELHPALIPNNDVLLANAEPFKAGATIVTTFSLVPGTEATTYVIQVNEGTVTFESSTGEFTITIGELLQILISGFDPSSIELPPGLPDIFSITISDFAYDADSKSVSVTMSLGGNVDLIPNLVTISDPTVTFDVTVATPRKVAVTGDAGWQIGSTNLPLTITRASDGNGFVVQASGSRLGVGEVLTQFGASLLPSELDPILSGTGLSSFEISNPVANLAVRSGLKDLLLFLSGEPKVSGWSGVTLNSVVVKKGNSKAIMAAGFDFANTNFAQLVHSITGVDVSGIKMLDQGMQSAVIISPQSIPGVSLEGNVLKQLSIEPGASIVAIFNFPADCGSDLVCKFAKIGLGSDADIRLRASITSAKQFVISAALADISLGGGLTLSPAGLEFKLGVETSVGITAALSLSDPALQFQGAVRAGIQGLELSLTMVGLWERAFGIEYLAFGNAIVLMNIIPGVPLPGLQLGAEVHVGDLNSGRELIGQCYVGFDPINPRRNYFYASINMASIGAILDAFDMSVSLPKVLLDSGFPKGLSSSFAFDTIEPVPGVVIPAGFRLNGTLNIIGYEVSADINLDPPSGLTVDINMEPINVAGGLFKLYRSKEDSSRGPRFYASVKTLPSPSVVVKASGYAKVLGLIELSAELEITNTQYIMIVSGPFFLFDATLKIYANYGSLKSASFRVYGLLSTAWMTEIKNKAVAAIQKGADEATAAIEDAQREVDKAQGAYDAAVKTLGSAKSSVDSAQRTYDSAVNSLKSAQNDVNSLCSIKSCSKLCIGCPKWDSCCTKIWGGCIGCPGWNGCCTRISDPICETANFACSALRATAYAALEIAKQVVDNTRWPLDLAKVALSAAQEIVDNLRFPLDIANGILEAIKLTVKAGAAAAEAITKLALGGLIHIRKIEFDVQIGVVQGGSFSGKIEVSFLGSSYKTLSFTLKLNSVVDMALDLAEEVFPGISGRRRRNVDGDSPMPAYTTDGIEYNQPTPTHPGRGCRPKPPVRHPTRNETDDVIRKVNSGKRRDGDSHMPACTTDGTEYSQPTPTRPGRGRRPKPPVRHSVRDETDDVIREVESEKRRQRARKRKLMREASQLRAAANSSDYVPVGGVEIDIATLHLDKLNAGRPRTREEACNHAQGMTSVLLRLSVSIQNITKGWKDSFDQYHSATTKVMSGLQRNTTSNYTSPDETVLISAVIAWRRRSYEHLQQQYNVGIRMMLNEGIGSAVEKHAGMKLREYLNRVIAVLRKAYAFFVRSGPVAKEIRARIHEIAATVVGLFTKSIGGASVDIDVMDKALHVLLAKMVQFCM